MRISTTLLESYRRWADEDWMPESQLLNQIRGIREETDQMRLGTAFHCVLETPDRYCVPGGYESHGFAFPDDTVRPLLALIDRRGPFEVKSSMRIGPHTVVAKADQIVGVRIYEHKTTTGAFDADKYLRSYQWRFEAAIFGALSVTYRVALVTMPTPDDPVVTLRGIEELTVYPYDTLTHDCCDLVGRFVDYIARRNLTSCLEPAADTVAAPAESLGI